MRVLREWSHKKSLSPFMNGNATLLPNVGSIGKVPNLLVKNHLYILVSLVSRKYNKDGLTHASSDFSSTAISELLSAYEFSFFYNTI